jgi:transcriptional regulator with XRE-family HTH domain
MDEELKKRIGLEIRVARTRAELKQEELGSRIKAPPSTVSQWETGHRIPSIAMLYRIAAVLDCEPFDLMPSVKTFEVISE